MEIPGFLRTHVAAGVKDSLPPAEQVLTKVSTDNEILRVVYVSLPPHGELSEHQVSGPVVVNVLQGEVEFTVGGETTLLSQADVVYLCPNDLHAVKALAQGASLNLVQIKAMVSDEDPHTGGCGCGGGGCGCGGH